MWIFKRHLQGLGEAPIGRFLDAFENALGEPSSITPKGWVRYDLAQWSGRVDALVEVLRAAVERR